MNMLSRCAATAVASLLLSGAALAQTAAPATKTAPSTMAPAAKTSEPRSAVSLDCSKQADAKGLHGQPRKKFRKSCMKAAKPS